MKFVGGNGDGGVRRRWRYYKTKSGRKPAREFLDSLPDEESAAVFAAMRAVAQDGTRAARHLEGDLWEVRADGDKATYRVIFSEEGKRSQVLLALEAFSKKTQKTPRRTIKQAKQRLKTWRSSAK